MKCLTVVDDATTEAVVIVPARALGGLSVTRVLDRLALERGLPRVLRTDNGKEFCGRAMLRRCCMNTLCRWGGVARTSRDPPQESHYGNEVEGSSHV